MTHVQRTPKARTSSLIAEQISEYAFRRHSARFIQPRTTAVTAGPKKKKKEADYGLQPQSTRGPTYLARRPAILGMARGTLPVI